MTGYDPFAYGQVRLGAGQGKPQGSPDDILFAEAGPLPGKPAAAKNSDWDPVDPVAPAGVPNGAMPQAVQDFAGDVLGEAVPTGAPQFGAVAGGGGFGGERAPVGFAPQATADQAAQPRRAQPTRPAGAGSQAAPARPKEKLAPARRPLPMQLDAHPSAAALLVPLLVVAAGFVGAAWTASTGGMPVLGALVGVATLIAAAFARISLTR